MSMRLDPDLVHNLADGGEEEVRYAMEQIKLRAAREPAVPVTSEQALLALLLEVDDKRSEFKRKADAGPPPNLEELFVDFDASYGGIGKCSSWANLVRLFGKDKTRFGYTVEELVAQVWNRNTRLLKRLQASIPPRRQEHEHEHTPSTPAPCSFPEFSDDGMDERPPNLDLSD